MGINQWKSTLRVEALPNGRTFRTLEPLCYESEDGEHYIVGTGTLTDFASVPRIIWNIVPPIGKYIRAAVLHDYLYNLHRIGDESLTRAQVDRILFHAMLDSNVHPLTAHLIWFGVKLGGGLAWMPEIKRRLWLREMKKRVFWAGMVALCYAFAWWWLFR